MQGTMTIITTDGSIVNKTITAQPSLEELQKAVGGWLEAVPGFDTYQDREAVVFCNEEGKLHHLPVNPVANIWWAKALGYQHSSQIGDVLVGDVLIVTGDDQLLGGL